MYILEEIKLTTVKTHIGARREAQTQCKANAAGGSGKQSENGKRKMESPAERSQTMAVCLAGLQGAASPRSSVPVLTPELSPKGHLHVHHQRKWDLEPQLWPGTEHTSISITAGSIVS